MQMKKIFKSIKIQCKENAAVMLIVATVIGMYGFSYLMSLMMRNTFSYGIFSVFVIAIIYIILHKTYRFIVKVTDARNRKKRITYSLIITFLFAVSLIMGYQLRMNGMMESGFKGKFLILFRGLCLAVCIFPFSHYLFYMLEKALNYTKKASKDKCWKNRNVFLISWGVVFLCWIPVFLAYYPAIMSHDFHRQSIEAAKGFVWFNNYQPLAHTWLIWVGLQIGYAVGDLAFGMACYSVFQMMIFSLACAYSCVTIYRLLHIKWVIILLAFFYGCFPLISVLSVTATKDILFSALFLIFVSLFIERSFLSGTKKQWIVDICWVLEGCIMMLYRNNAIYAVAVFAVVSLLLAEKKQKIRLFVMCLLLVIGGKGALEGVQLWIGTEGRGSKVEMFSVPIQTFSRVGYYHGDEMDEEIYELLNHYVPEEYWNKYTPAVSDSVKNHIAQWVYDGTWKNDLDGMLSAWIKIGLQYPNEYIDAFLMLNSGYWFIDDVSWSEVWGVSIEEHMGALSTYMSSVSDAIPEGIPHESKLPGIKAILENIVCGNSYYKWPVISALFKPALYSWGLLFIAIGCIYIKDKKKLLVTALPLVYLATMFLGPVVQARYMLPLIVILPLVSAILITKE